MQDPKYSEPRARRLALVTGGNKGIGREVVRQLAAAGLRVWLAARDPAKGEAAAVEFRQQGHDVQFIRLDVNDASSIAFAVASVGSRSERLDVLVNNAGILDAADGPPSIVDVEVVRRTLDTNFFGPLQVTRAFLPLLRRSPAASIVNVSSGLGSISLNADPDWEFARFKLTGYNTSKAALNLLTVMLAAELRETAIVVNAVSPEYTATDLNGFRGTHSVEEGAAEAVRLALNAEVRGAFLQSGGRLPW